MHKKYRWLLGITLLATFYFKWQESNESELQSSSQPVVAADMAKDEVIMSNEVVSESAELPRSAILRPIFAPAQRDIFGAVEAPKKVTPKVETVAPYVPPIEPAPLPNVRFLGSFVDPQGVLLLYLAQGTTEIEAKIGETLPNGYQVASATKDEVRLVYPRLGTQVIVPVTEDQ